ncbi:MAG: ABC transporter permease [Terricaulis sp.]
MLLTIQLEFFKLRRTLVWLLVLVAPILTAAMVGLIQLRQPSQTWMESYANAAGLWGLFVLPMTVTALTALLAQIEHQTSMWDVIFALPVARAKVFFAKAIVAVGLTGVMSCLLIAVSFLAIWAARAMHGLATFAPSPLGQFALITVAMWTAAGLMTIAQLWVALRFKSFLAPLCLGLAGTFVCLASMGAKEAIIVPWATPLSVMTHGGAQLQLALAFGGVGGCLAALAMSWRLAQREF